MKLKCIFLSIAIILLSGSCMFAQTSSQQTRRDKLAKEIAFLDKQIKQTQKQSKNALAQLNLIQSKVAVRQNIIKESDLEISNLNSAINAKQKQISALQSQLDTMSYYYGKLVMRAYKNRDARVWYMYMLASDSIAQGLRRFGYLKNLSSRMSEEAKKIKEAKSQLEKEKASLETMRASAKKLRDERMAELKKLKGEESQAKALSDKLKKNRAQYQRELAAKKKQADDLEREIRRSIKEAMGGGKKAGNNTKSKPIDYKLAGEFAANKGKLPWPVQGAVIARFGKQFHAVYKSLQLPMNNGVTVAVDEQAKVKAVYDGVVSTVKVFPGYHQCILIQHGNYFTLYSKMKNVYVLPGDKVKTNQELGTVDTINGETTFHFEIWDENSVPQNPEKWLRP